MTHKPVLVDTLESQQGIRVQRAEDILDHLYTALEKAAHALENTHEMDAGIKKRMDDMRAMQVLVLKEGEKLDDLNRKRSGAVGGQALDLDGARAEIECRLACLRNARGT